MMILSVDGGITRGVIPLTYLNYLESASNMSTSKMFDLMSSISTGAIITSALAISNKESDISQYSAKMLISLGSGRYPAHECF